MNIHFEAWAWKEIMQRTGGFITPFEGGDHKALNYIRLICEQDICSAFASDANGYTYCALRVPCKMEDKYARISFLVKPEKMPAKVIAIDLTSPENTEKGYKIKITYHYTPLTAATESVQEIPEDTGPMPDFEKHLDRLVNQQEQQYFISFRLDVLQRALSAFKGRGKDCVVVFHFGTQVQPALIETCDDIMPSVCVAICPTRLSNYIGGVKK